MTFLRLVLFMTCCSLPGLVLAEGAVRVLDCTVELQCNTSGQCDPVEVEDEVTFTMAPLQVNEVGAGMYDISYMERSAQMESRSFAGPFLWKIGMASHALLANSETSFLWHQLSLESQPTATIQYLDCQFTQ